MLHLVHEIFAKRQPSCVARKRNIIFTRVVHAGQEVEHSGVALDDVVSQTAAEYRSQIQGLQSIAHEICAAENEQYAVKIMIIARGALHQIRSGARSGKTISGVKRTFS